MVAGPGWSVSDDEARQALDILIGHLQGAVDVSTGGAPSRVAVGDDLELPSRIVTGDDGRILLRQGRTEVDISADSDVEIPEAAAEGQLIARMIQHRGTAFYNVETRPLEQLKLTVETPYLVAVVKGTQFTVAVVNGATTISLHEGTLEIRSPDGLQSIQLNAGEIAIRSLLDDTIRRLPMDADRLAEFARADVRDATVASRTDGTTDTVTVVGGGSDSVPTGGTATRERVALATEIASPAGAAEKTGVATEIGRVVPVVDATTSTNVSIDEAVDLGLDTRIATNVGLGGGDVDAGLDTQLDTRVDVGGTSVDLNLDTGLDTAIDLGGTTFETGLDLGADLSAGLDTGVDLGVDAGIDTGLDLGVDLGVDSGGLDLGLDLGLGSSGATGGTGSTGGSSGGSGQSGGGLLGGLLGPLL